MSWFTITATVPTAHIGCIANKYWLASCTDDTVVYNGSGDNVRMS